MRGHGPQHSSARVLPAQPGAPPARAHPSRADRPATVLVASDWAPIRAFEPIVRETPESIYGDLLPSSAAPTCASSTASAR